MPRGKHRKSPSYRHFTVVGIVCALIVAIGVFVPQFTAKQAQPCANSISCINDVTSAFEPSTEAIFMGKKITQPAYLAQDLNPQPNVLGASRNPKHIFVDLSSQMLQAYEGEKLVFHFPVSTGKWGRTPTGDFKIWIKLRSTRMEGGSGSDYYNLPNVPYTMFYYNDEVSKSRGFSLHGAYWHNNFGYPMSHGCVNIRPEDAEKLYNWAEPVTEGTTTYATEENPGTTVTIFGETPEH